jgi:hypothetical protein
VLAGLAIFALTVVVEPARLPQQAPPSSARVHVGDGGHKLRLWCSVGNVSQALDLGGGRWDAVYTAPSAGRPQVAVIGAWDEESGQAAVTTLALEGRMEFPAETDPGAQVQVQVGSHRATGRADTAGQARVTSWVSPEARVARITAVDAAGNTTVEEIKLEGPPPGVWLVAPPEAAEGVPARLVGFASGGTISVEAVGGEIEILQSAPGVLVANLHAHADVRLVARAGGAQASAAVRYRPKPPPGPPPPKPPPPPLPPKLVQPWWEVGATAGARYSGPFVGGGAALEARRRLRAGRWHLGLDLFGLYAAGNARSNDVSLGSVGVRAVAELRLPLGPLVALTLEGGLGGAYAYEHRTPVVGSAAHFSDGAPSLAVNAGLVARAGRGLVVLRLGFAWTPLVRLGLANLDGGMLSVGYRYGKF